MAAEESEKIAIVGGGISGLYCAYVLGKMKKNVHLFEATDRLGGRILTVRLKSRADTKLAGVEQFVPNPVKTERPLEDLEFYAEFGPMRVELDKQILLRALLRRLNIKEDARNVKDRHEPSLVQFPAYASPSAVGDPQYDLRADEQGKTPIDLLSLAMLRVMLKLRLSDGDAAYKLKRDELISSVQLAAATGLDVLAVFTKWVEGLDSEEYFAIQCHGVVDETPLYALGFWNLLSDYLSHNAILKIRDLGTFYHLLPENPNAAEWLTWSLVGLSISDNLRGVFGGMESLVDALVAKFDDLPNITVHRNHYVEKIEIADNTAKLDLSLKGESAFEGFDRVILALPEVPLRRLARTSPKAFEGEEDIDALLGSATAFPMIKVFVVVKDRWWGNERMANRFATRVPTRELHYWPARLNDRYGMIMFYTDRPATAFWSNYVPPGSQFGVSYPGSDEALPQPTKERLLKKIVQYLNENNVPDLKDSDILWYGIRDWGREPYGGANHMWRPERKYWQVIGRLGEIKAGPSARIHICGEAYSDYHGFIEGALRSAVYTLHRIIDSAHTSSLNFLSSEKLLESGDEKYLKALTAWCAKLDKDRNDNGSFLYTG